MTMSRDRQRRDERLVAAIRTLLGDRTALQIHDRAMRGLSARPVRRFITAHRVIDTGELLEVIGASERTLRLAERQAKRLGPEISDRTLSLAAVTMQAIKVLGSAEVAQRWLSSPAIGLDGRRPIDLIRSRAGTELVTTLLGRMEYGVYS